MGWETSLMTHITYSRKSYNDLYEVESDLELCEDTIGRLKQELRDLALMTEPEKWFKNSEDGTPYEQLKWRVEEILEELDEEIIESYKLGKLKDAWKHCHNEKGLAIADPEGIEWNTSFLDGDFVKSTRNNGEF